MMMMMILTIQGCILSPLLFNKLNNENSKYSVRSLLGKLNTGQEFFGLRLRICITTSCKETLLNSYLCSICIFFDNFYRWMRFIFCQTNIDWVSNTICWCQVLIYYRNIKVVSNAHKVIIKDVCYDFIITDLFLIPQEGNSSPKQWLNSSPQFTITMHTQMNYMSISTS